MMTGSQMVESEARLVLDTHTWIWLVDGSPELSTSVRRRIDRAAQSADILIPAICVWELAKLEITGRLALSQGARAWVKTALEQPGIAVVPLSSEIALESCFLPG